ncbi:ALP1-like protein [Tanacetum coccineum]
MCFLREPYTELATLVKTISEPADDDHKRILYNKKQESIRKDVERAFGVLKKKWAILANPTRELRKDRIVNMMYTCIILHNMIRKYKEVAISPTYPVNKIVSRWRDVHLISNVEMPSFPAQSGLLDSVHLGLLTHVHSPIWFEN